MTECREGCGACCQPVRLPHSRRELEMMPPFRIDAYTRWWALNILRPISRKEGLALAPWERGSSAMPVVNGDFLVHPSSFYLCSWFDEETRRCTHYDDRPTLCRSYPREGHARVLDGKALPPMCSYREEQGQPVEPLPEWQPVALVVKA